MRNFFILCVMFMATETYAQTLPIDDALLKVIYGKAYTSGGVYTRPFTAEEQHSASYKQAEYRVAYKSFTAANTPAQLLVIVESPINTLHGHVWGYIDYYFLTSASDKWKVASVQKSEEPIGDTIEFKEIAIGKSKTALVRTFESTGNQHYEKTHEVYYLTPAELTFLFEITVEYSNAAFNTASPNAECFAKKYNTTYEVIDDGRDWFDVKTHEKLYGFDIGCKEAILSAEIDSYFKHNGTEYKQQLVIPE